MFEDQGPVRRRTRLVIGALFLFVAGTGGGSLVRLASAHGGDASKIHGCVLPGGALLIVGPSTNCPAGQTPLDWNSQGRPGPAGVSGYELVKSTSPLMPSGARVWSAKCPEGKKAFGGSGRAMDDNGHMRGELIVISTILTAGDYSAAAENFGDLSIRWQIEVVVSCAKV